jgi:hypothetical protein
MWIKYHHKRVLKPRTFISISSSRESTHKYLLPRSWRILCGLHSYWHNDRTSIERGSTGRMWLISNHFTEGKKNFFFLSITFIWNKRRYDLPTSRRKL